MMFIKQYKIIEKLNCRMFIDHIFLPYLGLHVIFCGSRTASYFPIKKFTGPLALGPALVMALLCSEQYIYSK